MPALLVAVCLIAVSGGIGALMLPKSVWNGDRTLVLSASVALGFGVLAAVCFALGFSGVLLTLGRYGLPPTVAIVSAVGYIRLFKRMGNRGLVARTPLSGLEVLLVVLLVLLALKNLLASFTPEIRHDAKAYHVLFPLLYVSTGKIENYPWSIMFHLPENMEMLYTLGLLWGSDSAPKMLHCMTGIMTVGVLYCLGKRLFGRRASLVAAFVFYVQPQVAVISNTAYNDLGRAFFELLAFGALMEFWRSKTEDPNKTEMYWIYMAAVFAGLSLGIKWPSFPVFFAPLLLVHAWFGVWRGLRGWFFMTWLILLVIPLLMFTPWLFKNYLFTGNPVYPFLNRFFGLTDEVSRAADAFIKRCAPPSDTYALTRLLPYWRERFRDIGHAGSVIVWIYWPVVLLFVLAEMLEKFRKRPERKIFTVFTGFPKAPTPELMLLLYSIFSLGGHLLFTYNADGRFLLPAYPMCALLLGRLWTAVEDVLNGSPTIREQVRPGFLSGARGLIVLFLLAGSVRHQILAHIDLGESWRPIPNRVVHIRKNPLMPGLEALPEGSYVFGNAYPVRVKFLGVPYFGRDILAELTGPPPYSGETLYRSLRELGITHVIYPADYRVHPEAFEDLLQRHVEKMFSSGGETLYALRD